MTKNVRDVVILVPNAVLWGYVIHYIAQKVC